jgi:hypothetical protein
LSPPSKNGLVEHPTLVVLPGRFLELWLAGHLVVLARWQILKGRFTTLVAIVMFRDVEHGPTVSALDTDYIWIPKVFIEPKLLRLRCHGSGSLAY